LALATYNEGLKDRPISELETRVKKVMKGNPAKRQQFFIEPLQKALTEAEAAAVEAKAIGHERFTTEAEVIRSLAAAMLALHRGLAARHEGAADARDFFATAQREFKRFEAIWPTVQRLNPGTEPKGPMAGYRRDLPGLLASLEGQAGDS